jgi:hypothetical protein
MGLQTILSVCESIGINDQRFVGQTVSRNQRIVTSEYETVVPFAFDLKPMAYLLYSQNRAVLNLLRIADKALTQYLNFAPTGWVNYIAYRGSMTSVQIASCLWQTASANKILVLGNLPSISSTAYIVRAGDFCQIDSHAYIATADVLRGVGSTVNIPVHRNLIAAITSTQNAVIGQYGTTITMDGSTYTGVTFPVILRDYPTYSLMPFANDSYIAWNGSFKAFEFVA